jgi:DNA-binding response OmpR family regulator
MRVLVIEDNEHRRKFFAEFLKGDDIDMVETVPDALKTLDSSKYDVIYLDP